MSFARKPSIPHGPEELNCPLWQKSMDEVCHKCPWWKQLRGKNPQTDEDVDSWHCAIEMLPLLQLETSQQVRQAGAATEELRNIAAGRVSKTGYPNRFKQVGVTTNSDPRGLIEHKDSE